MEPSQPNNVQKDHEERVISFDSDINKRKEQLLKEFEDSSDDSRKHRPKHSKSKANQHEVSDIEESPSEQRPFGPFVVNTLQALNLIKSYGFVDLSVTYSEKHNLILGCYADGSLHFYDVTTLLPVEGINTEVLERPAPVISFWPETDTVIFGCFYGHVYAYNLSRKILKNIRQVQNHVVAMAFINSKFYAFACDESQKLFIGNLENENLIHYNLGNNISYNLFCLPNKKLLFSSLKDGAVQIYRTDQVPRLPMISSIRGFNSRGRNLWRSVESVTINGKDYMIICGAERKIKILHFLKGKMTLLKVIPVQDKVIRMVYLENYRILATTHNSQFVRFYSLPSGKLECTLDLAMEKCCNIFLMKEKNCIGVVSQKGDMIKFIQLHGGEEKNETGKL